MNFFQANKGEHLSPGDEVIDAHLPLFHFDELTPHHSLNVAKLVQELVLHALSVEIEFSSKLSY